MKKKALPKLNLSKETLRDLEQRLVRGGQSNPADPIDSAYPSCASVCATC